MRGATFEKPLLSGSHYFRMFEKVLDMKCKVPFICVTNYPHEKDCINKKGPNCLH